MEVRFEPAEDYSVVPGLVFPALRKDYPQLQQLPAAVLPHDPAFPPVIRNRFTSTDGKQMVQLGIGIVSINRLAYTSYKDFKSDCAAALTALQETGVMGQVTRTGLRYINNAPLERDAGALIRYRVEAPDLIEAHAKSREFTWTSEHGDDGNLTTRVAWPVKDKSSAKEGLLLDFDFYSHHRRPLSVEEILAWEEVAHNYVYDVFVASLQQDYFDSLLGNDDV